MTEHKNHINILFVEDLITDLELARRSIRKENIENDYRLVETEEEFIKELKSFTPDIVVSDYSMPMFDGMKALKLTRELSPDTPFIILTGSMNEETAVACMKAGADDYVLKEKITRLPFAIKEAIDKKKSQQEKKRMETQLINSLEEYHDLINGMNETVWIIDTNGTLLDVNKRAETLLGYSRKELLGLGINGIDAILSHNQINKLIRNLKEDNIQVFETKHKTKSGKLIPVEISSSLIQYQGQTAILCVARDITDRKKAKEQIQLLSKAVEQNPLAIEITDKHGTIEYVNPAIKVISGYNPDEVIGNNPRMFNSGYHTEEFYKGLWQTIRSGNTWQGELRNKKKDGTIYWEQAIISPIINDEGEIIHFVGIKEDITDKKHIMADLLNAKEKAEESDRLKSAFLANMSHEVRTPMNGIIGFADLLTESDLSEEEKTKYLEVIQRSGKRMLDTVNDIIEVSKIDTGQVSVKENSFNLWRMFEEKYVFFNAEASEKNIHLELINTEPDEPIVIISDESKLNSIIVNLIKNAIKFTPKGVISFGYSISGNKLRCFVKDTGIGIPKDKQKQVFERFTKSDVENKMAYQGSGLGLSISRSYAEILGGSITLQSSPGVGTEFIVEIPIDIPANDLSSSAENEKSELPLASGNKINLLIADDDDDAIYLLKTVLKDYTAKVLQASNGNEAISLCRENPDINLILMDVKMPQTDGLQATREIRKFNKNMPIIAQTAFATFEDKEKALEAGCTDYISKPINHRELIQMINKYYHILQ
jgi:PAS domain S-box-containing protein